MPRASLIALYEATDGSSWTHNQGWPRGDPCADMFGTSCLDDRIFVKLHTNGLRGTLPSNLEGLEQLEVWNNAISGTLATQLGQLSLLRLVSVDGNQLSGYIPTELGMLQAVEHMTLYGNAFSGTVPSSLGKLSSISNLLIGRGWKTRMAVSGTIPPELTRLDHLSTALAMSGMQLSGTLPSQVGMFTALGGHLQFDNNWLSGTLPTEIGLLTALTDTLGLEFNSFTGTLPSQIGRYVESPHLTLRTQKPSTPLHSCSIPHRLQAGCSPLLRRAQQLLDWLRAHSNGIDAPALVPARATAVTHVYQLEHESLHVPPSQRPHLRRFLPRSPVRRARAPSAHATAMVARPTASASSATSTASPPTTCSAASPAAGVARVCGDSPACRCDLPDYRDALSGCEQGHTPSPARSTTRFSSASR